MGKEKEEANRREKESKGKVIMCESIWLSLLWEIIMSSLANRLCNDKRVIDS